MGELVGFSELGEIEQASKWEEIASSKSTEDLLELGRTAQEGSIRFFFLQCLISSIIAKRRDGGLRVLAREWGLAYNRASEMGRIWREIIKPMIDRGLHPPIELEPEYFHIALRAPEPVEAIIYAQDQKNSSSGFTCAKLKTALKTGMPENIKDCAKCSHFFNLENVKYSVVLPTGKSTEIEGGLMLCDKFGVLRPLGNFNLQEKAASCNIFQDRYSLGTTSREPLETTNTSSEGSSM